MAADVTIAASASTGNIQLRLKDDSGSDDFLRLTMDGGQASPSTIAMMAPDLTGIEKLEIISKNTTRITGLQDAESLKEVKVSGPGSVTILTGDANFESGAV